MRCMSQYVANKNVFSECIDIEDGGGAYLAADGQRDADERAGCVARRPSPAHWRARGRDDDRRQTLADDARRRPAPPRGTPPQQDARRRDQQPHRPSAKRRRQRRADAGMRWQDEFFFIFECIFVFVFCILRVFFWDQILSPSWNGI